jgi:nucleotide-binding universal stress UspA family protein
MGVVRARIAPERSTMAETEVDPLDEILVAVDFSGGTEHVLAVAARVAAASGASVHLLHVAAPEPGFVGYDKAGGPEDRDHRADELRDEHQGLGVLADAMKDSGITVKPLLVKGATIEVILGEANRLGADLIVVGSHGHGAMHRFLVGSTPDALVRQSEIPVLVVPVPS